MERRDALRLLGGAAGLGALSGWPTAGAGRGRELATQTRPVTGIPSGAVIRTLLGDISPTSSPA